MNFDLDKCLKCGALKEKVQGFELLNSRQRGEEFCLQHAEEWIRLQAHALNTLYNDFIQPERSKREDFSKYLKSIKDGFKPRFTITPEIQEKLDILEKVRCSELHGNMERDK